ncbi:MAG: hypothetical protein ABIJ75_07180 [Actinomycetota bacterium]
MTLEQEYLDECHGDPVEAAALLALRLTRGDPASFKAGYSRPSAILSAIKFFPEVTGAQIVARNHPFGWGSNDLPLSMRPPESKAKEKRPRLQQFVLLDVTTVNHRRFKKLAKLQQMLGFVRNQFPGRKPLHSIMEAAYRLHEQSQLSQDHMDRDNDQRIREGFSTLAADLEALWERLETCRKALRR